MTTRSNSVVFVAAWLCGCASKGPAPLDEAQAFSFVARAPNAAFLGVSGTDSNDVWLAGADDGSGPLVLHSDGHAWEQRATGVSGDLWWVHPTAWGPVFFGGSNALVLRYDGGAFAALDTPGPAAATVFGVWAAADDDVYAVGSVDGKNGFVWHFDGTAFSAVPLDGVLPVNDHGETPGLFKVWGTSADDVWVVGASSAVLRGSALAGFTLVQAGGSETLFTVHARDGAVVMVGGGSSGVILAANENGLVDETPAGAPLLQGVSIAPDASVWAVGYGGSVYHGVDGVFTPVDPGLDFTAAESLHSVWVDPSGGVWAAGGNVLTPALDDGLAMHLGGPAPSEEQPSAR
ncbi:MAG TPA: hypothetical protein VMI54_22245 [Polyangiaceae bacterium]|nr:hypothetical protein [Polyangiaceae bacterium]